MDEESNEKSVHSLITIPPKDRSLFEDVKLISEIQKQSSWLAVCMFRRCKAGMKFDHVNLSSKPASSDQRQQNFTRRYSEKLQKVVVWHMKSLTRTKVGYSGKERLIERTIPKKKRKRQDSKQRKKI